jgi:hypothetical protein
MLFSAGNGASAVKVPLLVVYRIVWPLELTGG